MSTHRLPLTELVEQVVSGVWGVPEWQRTFEATAAFVARLADSLHHGMLIGGLTLWDPTPGSQVRSRYAGALLPAEHGQQLQLLDGQQRVTSIALMFGVRPGWLPERTWAGLQRTHGVEVCVPRRHVPPLFADTDRLRTGTTFLPRGKSRPSYAAVPLDALLHADADPRALADQYAVGDAAEALRKVLTGVRDRLRAGWIGTDYLPGDHLIARENFVRLNTSGRKVSATTIEEGFTAIRMPGFSTDHLDPFMETLAARGRPDIRRDDVLRTFRRTVELGGAGYRTATLEQLQRGWAATVETWMSLLDYLDARGVLSRGEAAGDGARVKQPITLPLLWTLHVHLARWPEEAEHDFLLHWAVATAVQEQRPSGPQYRRYEGVVRTAPDVRAARAGLMQLTELEIWPDLQADELQARSNDFPALLAYLAAWPDGVPALTGASSRPVGEVRVERALPYLSAGDLAHLVLADVDSAEVIRTHGLDDTGRNQLRTAISAADAQWIPRSVAGAFAEARTAQLTDPRHGLGARLRDRLPAPAEYLLDAKEETA